MNDATPRQVLYALVAGGFIFVVALLTVGGAAAGVVPTWWSAALAFIIAIATTWMAQNWRSTLSTLLVAIGVFVLWMVGTAILAT